MIKEIYNQRIDLLLNWIMELPDEVKWEKEIKAVYDLQHSYMTQVLEDYKSRTPFEGQKYICQLLEYVISSSTSGNVIIHVPTKEMAIHIDKIICDELGDMILDPSEIYKEEDGKWAMDYMFAGRYVPEWEGYYEAWMCKNYGNDWWWRQI